MTLIKTTPHIADLNGSFKGQTFKRDKSGLHIIPKPRRTKQRSSAQNRQRQAFSKARAFSTNNRTVSYNIYQALNNLPMKEPPLDYQPPGQ